MSAEATRILAQRWPETLIGEVQSHGGKDHQYILTEQGWESLSVIRSVSQERAIREARARAQVQAILDDLSPEEREEVIRALVEMFGAVPS